MILPTCKTCPYFFCPPLKTRDFRGGVNVNGECRRSPRYHDRHSDCWCGEHPDFADWLEFLKQRQKEAGQAAKRDVATAGLDSDSAGEGGESAS